MRQSCTNQVNHFIINIKHGSKMEQYHENEAVLQTQPSLHQQTDQSN